ncbi:hypothetical protein DSM106972_005540 [Dulcicalothrix desertica PCC 7102]|uniref:Uncharacterized protein n=1 Tax=Dulcicalothrix desertica PCC 7102 TaxID=232991 RepID=A0A433VVE1_9CYAN|nr:hypothetical protein [Dulcicalothrix desertica]RUT10059.1 hypothetical protein DSM106972_005540 [Dulcicalothrix desertica PCC 7102]TWH40962.1 hypothetical protein CAL7102_10326 [Dulcicalothrix desertica PCC 7102]
MSNFEEANKLIESNAKAIQKMMSLRDFILPRIDKMQQKVADMQQQVVIMQRHKINNQERYSDSTDIKELMLENQRILNYLESLNK